jgi:hypothetical protein
MIVIRLWGGIGNQLFQYSFGEYLRLKTGQDVKYDIASFGRVDKLRQLEIKILNPDIPIIENIKISHHKGLLNRFLRYFFCLKSGNRFVMESDFSEDIFSNIPTDGILYLQGYWQKEVYPNELLKRNTEFFLPCMEIPYEIQAIEKMMKVEKQTIALHVRRGDYFISQNIKQWGVCDPDYYNKALNFLYQKNESCKVFVFSDDLEWVKNNINLSPNTFFVPNYKINSFWFIHLMSCCLHNIISNSSFSWWGAFLNRNAKGIVIAPKQWKLNSDKTIVLAKWVTI